MSHHHNLYSFISKERIRIDYTEFIPTFNLTVGKVNQAKAYKPIEPHIHKDSFEIVYIVKGQQIYTIESTSYSINSGECFITLPNEMHSSGGHPEDKSILYYVIIPISLIETLGFDTEESQMLHDILHNPPHRSFLGISQLPQILESLSMIPNIDMPFYKTQARQLLTQFLLYIISSMYQTPSESDTSLTSIKAYIHEHINEQISIQELAKLMNLSESRFKIHFRKTIGIPPAEYILREKVAYSKALLENPSLSITDIALELSFSSSQYFSTVFKRFTTLSPSQYRTHYNND